MVVQLWVLVTRQAGFLSGVPPLVGGCLGVWLTGRLLRQMSPPFGTLIAQQAGAYWLHHAIPNATDKEQWHFISTSL